MNGFTEYTEKKHYRNFAIWAASRAASRGHKGLTIDVWHKAIESNIFNLCYGANRDEFDRHYCDIIDRLKDSVNNSPDINNPICFGRAAKFLSIYCKAMYRHSANDSSTDDNYSKNAHPPIDRILLKNVARKFGSEVCWNQPTKLPTWTTINRNCYMRIIKDFRKVLNGEPLWKIEYYWSATEEE